MFFPKTPEKKNEMRRVSLVLTLITLDEQLKTISTMSSTKFLLNEGFLYKLSTLLFCKVKNDSSPR